MTFVTVDDAYKTVTDVFYDIYESDDRSRPGGPPPKNIRKHRKVHMVFRTPRDAENFFNILTLAIDKWEIEDNKT